MFNENTQFEATKTSCLELIYTMIQMIGVRGYYKDVIMHDIKVTPADGGINCFMQEMLENVGHDDLKVQLSDIMQVILINFIDIA